MQNAVQTRSSTAIRSQNGRGWVAKEVLMRARDSGRVIFVWLDGMKQKISLEDERELTKDRSSY